MTTTSSEYDRELKQFLDGMRYKLHKNKHKGRWEDLTVERALELLKAEVVELEEAIKNDNQIEIILESCDVGNFAMISANLAMKKAVGNV